MQCFDSFIVLIVCAGVKEDHLVQLHRLFVGDQRMGVVCCCRVVGCVNIVYRARSRVPLLRCIAFLARSTWPWLLRANPGPSFSWLTMMLCVADTATRRLRALVSCWRPQSRRAAPSTSLTCSATVCATQLSKCISCVLVFFFLSFLMCFLTLQ